jgi:hypothetical protein
VAARVVAVAAGAAQTRGVPPQKAIAKVTEMNNWQGILTFTDNLHSRFPFESASKHMKNGTL